MIASKADHEQLIATAGKILPEDTKIIFTKDTFEEYFAEGAHAGLQLLLGGQSGLENPHHVVMFFTQQELMDLLHSDDPFIAWVIEDAHHRLSGSYTLRDE